MGILDRILFWRKPTRPEYEITDCFGEANPSGYSSHSEDEALEVPTLEEE